ncbi:von Willebrand factor A domain-containing protein 5A-like [Xenia sp. Carnegie-2017]|uniref:von Willebrand factor A domain-containing protein 5A-like n=1 Tax=Xenia sp. Carnegie-2017 TaxID=2897299 RepID=UPI001F049CC7|nr:von Willebrand factor A domain-containing protein 5A-like [Xenia sp. Carnegie-2017]
MLTYGVFICDRNEEVPLKSQCVRSFLKGQVVGFRSTLTYVNHTENPLEVFFRTPVDDSFAVVGLEACIDGKKIRAEIQEKEKAREKYKEAVSSGRTAAFGEEKQGDIFSLVLGNLPPKEMAVLELTMVGELNVEAGGAVRFVLPKVLKPRYTPTGSNNPLAPEVSSDSGATAKQGTGPDSYQFSLEIDDAPNIDKVTSPSHKIFADNDGEKIKVTLTEVKQTDIVILVQPKEINKPLIIVEPGLSNGENNFQKSSAIMVSFIPEFKGENNCLQAACEFVFVIDRSGSMAGSYIKDAAETLLLFLKSIPEGCYFNIIGFGSTYVHLFPESVPYNQKFGKAVKHAENLQADLGGTELFDPLKEIFSHAPKKGLPRQVFVLTDGSISNTDSVIQLVKKNSNNSRCFSFGIGSGASTTLVKGIAQAGKGAAEFIVSGERMQPKVIRSLKKAMQPSVTDVQISVTVSNNITVNVVPKEKLPPIFIGECLIVYAILHDKSTSSSPQEGKILLSGDLLAAKVEHKMNFPIKPAVKKETASQVSTIHHLAAKKLIKELELDGGKKAEIIQLSCDSNVISSQTAFIAIDQDRKQAVKGSLHSWDLMPQEEEEFMLKPPVACGGTRSSDRGFKCLIPIPPRSAPKFLSLSNDYQSVEVDQILQDHSDTKSCAIADGILEDTKFGGDSSNPLSQIINLQLANGAWELTSAISNMVGKSITDLKDACPVSCNGNMMTIWATCIVLAYLDLQLSTVKDEWELVGMKAKSWLMMQVLPQGCSYEDLQEKANQFLCDNNKLK